MWHHLEYPEQPVSISVGVDTPREVDHSDEDSEIDVFSGKGFSFVEPEGLGTGYGLF